MGHLYEAELHIGWESEWLDFYNGVKKECKQKKPKKKQQQQKMAFFFGFKTTQPASITRDFQSIGISIAQQISMQICDAIDFICLLCLCGIYSLFNAGL